MSSDKAIPNSAPLRRLGIAAICVGGMLAITSLLPVFSTGSERWSIDKAREYQQASLQIQELSHKLGNRSADEASREDTEKFRNALDRFASLRGELEHARDRSSVLRPAIQVLAAVLIAIGIFSYIATLRLPARDMAGVHIQRNSPEDSSGQLTA